MSCETLAAPLLRASDAQPPREQMIRDRAASEPSLSELARCVTAAADVHSLEADATFSRRSFALL